jgi:hypothetical protein
LRHVVNWSVVLANILLNLWAIVAIAARPFVPPVMAIVGPAAGLLSLAASMAAIWRPGVAARIDRWLMPIVPFLALAFPHAFGYGDAAILRAIAVFAGAIVLPGLFWRWTTRRGWPPPLANTAGFRRSWLTVVAASGLFSVLVAIALVWSLGVLWQDPLGDCGGGPLFDSRGVPANIDFVAKIVFVGPPTVRDLSLWSVARVEQRFSGPPSWFPKFVVLRGFFAPIDGSRKYFVEGKRSYSCLTRYLPVIEPVSCGHTRPAEEATVEIQMLREWARLTR